MIRTFVRALLCGFIALCLTPLAAQHTSTSRVSRATVTITQDNADKVHEMGIDLTHGQYVPGKFLTTDLTDWQIEHIRSLGFQVDIQIEDVTAYYQERKTQRSPLSCQQNEFNYSVPKYFELGSMGGHLTYSEMLDALDLMQLLYPELITSREKVGTDVTHQGRPLYWVRISDNPQTEEPEPSILYTGLHHAREPISMMQMIYYMWYLLENYETDPEVNYLVNNTELYFIPCVNPDGYVYNEQIAPDGGGSWRKNMRDNDGSGSFEEKEDGVDLNRNYGYHWGVDDVGSSGHAPSEVYRGPEPFSEPETRAIRTFVQQHNFFAALNYHAFGNVFIYPWGYTEETNPDLSTFENYGELFALDNDFKIGTSAETVGYPTNGSSDDWMYGVEGVYAMTPEVGGEEDGFWPAEDDIIYLAQSSLKNNLALAHLPLDYALATDVSGAFLTSMNGTLDIHVKRYGTGLGIMALTAMSLSPDLTVDGTILEVDLDRFEEETYELPYSLATEAQGGEAFSFVIILDNGFFEYRDTITKVLAGETLAFFEDGNDLSEWTTEGSAWGSTDEDAHTGTYSFTDSPDGPSTANAESAISLIDPIDLTDAQYAVLQFWSKWEIEELIDYARVQISTDGVFYSALCGQNSVQGSVFQLPEPIYDGVQQKWVKESIDLSPYLGTQIYLRYTLRTDAFLNLDGIYVDDVKVYLYKDDITGTSEAHAQGSLNVWPNPAANAFWINLEESAARGAQVVITDALGAKMESVVLQGGNETLRIDTQDWSKGLYFVSVFNNGSLIASDKVLVQ